MSDFFVGKFEKVCFCLYEKKPSTGTGTGDAAESVEGVTRNQKLTDLEEAPLGRLVLMAVLA
jgi:hypothetical protein